MNNKGFTLVELLAVILILSLLALLASTSVTKVVRDSKSDLYNSQIEIIKLAADSWGSENIDKLPESGECKYITLSTLKEYGLIDSNIKNPKTNKKFDNNIKIKISSNKTSYDTLKFVYEIDPEDVSLCNYAMPVCVLAKDSENDGTELGAKYNCKVDPDEDEYTFYVISTNADGTVNLIMNQNINNDGSIPVSGLKSSNIQYDLVEWQSSGNNADGPVNVIQFLHNATKNWTNIPPINFIYNDKTFQGGSNGYTSITSNNGIATITSSTGTITTVGTNTEPLRSRLIIYSSDASKTEVVNKTTAPYLYENIDSSGTTAPYAYWTLSSYSTDSNFAWFVHYTGDAGYSYANKNDSIGVRPVITLEI